MLENKAQESNSNMDFTKLRMAHTRTENYDPYSVYFNLLKAEMISAINNNKFVDVLKIAHEILEKNSVNIYAHRACAIAYGQLNDKEKEDFHSRTVRGLLTSILQSGDGRTKESAFVVISTDEEYALVNMLGFQIKSQSSIEDDDHQYDLLQVYDPKSQKDFNLYFNIDILLERVAKRLQKTK
jgi:hypothetical protein